MKVYLEKCILCMKYNIEQNHKLKIILELPNVMINILEHE